MIDRHWWKHHALCEAFQKDSVNIGLMTANVRLLFVLYAVTVGIHALVIALLMACIRVEYEELRYVRNIERGVRIGCDFFNWSVMVYRVFYTQFTERSYFEEMYPLSITHRVNWTFIALSVILGISISLRIVRKVVQ
jgi:hypothetical protein